MSDDGNRASDGISFDKAEFDGGSEQMKCQNCSQTVTGEYYLLHQEPLCASCRSSMGDDVGGGKEGGLAKAALFGLGGAAMGTLVWLTLLWTTGWEVGLLAILIGWTVGRLVFLGSGERGGLKYQLLAVGLTYASICGSYVPLILSEFSSMETTTVNGQEVFVFVAGDEAGSEPTAEQMENAIPLPDDEDEDLVDGQAYLVPIEESEQGDGSTLLAFLSLFALALALPFLAGFENLIGLLIIGFGLWQAWKTAAAPDFLMEGPFETGSSSTATSA